ncbi:hypothetical protein [Cellulomonas sp. URHE0023]|uniref:hypothetical protein n=1 Tax=Cellulomonas sp. URHE0023 TaxID=1380354 RepID=UPI000482953C|nr:hypothetical protein [Cellulomonas sp. URHE0023]
MTSVVDPPRSRAWLHLLWSVPVAVGLSVVPLFMASFILCGISGCSGGGFGVSDGGREAVPLLLLIAATLVAAPFVAVPWSRSRWRCRIVAGLVFLGWLVLISVPIYDQWRNAAPPV